LDVSLNSELAATWESRS